MSTGTPGARLTGTNGRALFALAGASISGWYPSYKGTGTAPAKQPFTTQAEFRLGLYLEYHPWVASYQRGDMSPAFARAYALPAPLGTPYPLSYTTDGQVRAHLPAWVGTLATDGLFLADARATAAAEAARHWAALNGGLYWLAAGEALSRRRHDNWLYLHARRPGFAAFDEIAAAIRADWPWYMATIRDF